MKKNESVEISKMVIVLVLVLFSILTAIAVSQYGFIGIFTQAFQNYATIQVFVDLFVDLLISLFLILLWMWSDAKKPIELSVHGHYLL